MSAERHRRLKDIFLRASELAPEARDAFLAAACGGDDALALEARKMLDADATASNALDRPPVPLRQGLREGRTLDDRFEIVALLGEGGLGEVWRARQLHPVAREVAVKVIRRGMDTESVVARFEAERQVLAMLEHPDVAQVFDAGSTPDGRPYLVMECIDGQPITQYCDERNQPLEARLRLFVRVCRAIAHAHRKGILHRDLKPSNVLVAEVDGVPAPKVIDFGIAKLIGARPSARLTLDRQVVGTPMYMAPEQAAGGSDVDTRADVYALGALLYELLTGTTPFDPERLRSASDQEIARIVQEEEPLTPSTRVRRAQTDVEHSTHGPPRGVAAALLRGDLDWIVLKAMDKQRESRYEGASQLADDIERYLDHRPVRASPRGAAYRLRKLARRHRLPMLASAALLVTLVGGLVAVTLAHGHARDAERRARIETREAERARDAQAAARRRAEDALEEARTVTALLSDVLGAADPTRAGHDVRVVDALEHAERLIAQRLGERPRVEVQLRRTLGITYRQLGMLKKAEHHLTTALGVARSAFPDDDEALLSVIGSLSALYDEQGRPDAARPMHEEALRLTRKVLGPTARRTLGAMCNYGLFLQENGKAAEAEAQLRETLALMTKTLPDTDPYLLNCMQGLGNALLDLERFEPARQQFEEVRRRSESARDGAHPITIAALYSLARVAQFEARTQDALALYDEALRRAQRTYPEGHWRRGLLRMGRGEALLPSEPGKALRELEAAYTILCAAFGAGDRTCLELASKLAELHETKGDPSQAAGWRERAGSK